MSNVDIPTTKNSKTEKMHVLKIAYRPSTVFEKYFNLKNALVGKYSDAAPSRMKHFSTTIDAVKMDENEMNVYLVWIKTLNDLKQDASQIISTKNSKEQRNYFGKLSNHSNPHD